MKSETITIPKKKERAQNDASRSSSPIQTIRSHYLARKQKNPHYSLRAFARDTGLTSGHLTRILNGTRALTLKQGMQIAAMLEFSEAETQQFVLGIVERASKNAKISKVVRERIKQGAYSENGVIFTNYEIEHFKTIAQWYHLAILNLSAVDGFSPRPDWIAKKLGITSVEATDAIERLLELGMLEKTETGIKRTKMHFHIPTHRSEIAMRKFHTQMIEKAKKELLKTSNEAFSRRLINGITFVCAPEHIPLLQKKIDEFQDEILNLTRSGPRREVYQMNCQLFPLIQNGEKP